MMMRIRTLQVLEALCEALEKFTGKMRERCAVCQHCGRNRYTGAACIKFPEAQ
jgi:hypothetical protein